jgi:aminoglycoside/choline kinase family phosphotransferase
MTQTKIFTESPISRLQSFLSRRFSETTGRIEPLTPDASIREYFRINWEMGTAIACVYPEAFALQEQSYLDVTNLFVAAGLPVAEIYDSSAEFGVIVHEDFGDNVLRSVLDSVLEKEKDGLLNQAIILIAEIQAATPLSFELNSVASRLAFDFDKLSWEHDFFTKHYFETFLGRKLSDANALNLKRELDEVARALEARISVLCHRDFHSANLMIDRESRLRIIDHQDARMGAASYDLVSLLLDRIDVLPSDDWIAVKQQFFLDQRATLSLPKIEAGEFASEFRLQTIQRCLKAIGTFSYQTAVRGKTGYAQYIEPMLVAVLNAAEESNRFPYLQNIIKEQIKVNQ